jgi:unsaturated rhamnogalacturonyl hydrolase
METGLRKICAALALASLAVAALPADQTATADPLEIARILAARYPAQPIMSYIPALSWSGQLRLSVLTGEPRWREKALKDIQAFTSGQKPAIAEPYRLTSLAGALAFSDAAQLAGDRAAGVLSAKVAYFILPEKPEDDVKFQTGWTDDMFMAGAVLSRSYREPRNVLRRMLKMYANRLQRPDGLFVHAESGPHAWGRGNGFALLGVTEALTHMPESWEAMPEPWATRPQVLEIYRRHIAALAKHQADDGSWRQVVDEPTSYRELTVTAMTTAALARGIARGWIDRGTYEPIMNRGWQAVAARVNADGTVKDVCSGTGAGPTKEYYLNRPVVNGADDRGGAMALLAAIEIASLRR